MTTDTELTFESPQRHASKEELREALRQEARAAQNTRASVTAFPHRASTVH